MRGQTQTRQGKHTYNEALIHLLTHLIIVTCPQINHNMLVAEEEHEGTFIIQLIHDIEIRHL